MHTYTPWHRHVFSEYKPSTQPGFGISVNTQYLYRYWCIPVIKELLLTSQYNTDKHFCIRYNLRRLKLFILKQSFNVSIAIS